MSMEIDNPLMGDQENINAKHVLNNSVNGK